MSERRDNTPPQPPTESPAPRRPEQTPPRPGYYDDDATGYEPYDPQAGDEDETSDDARQGSAQDC